jgi:sperm-associated antigen 16 protein
MCTPTVSTNNSCWQTNNSNKISTKANNMGDRIQILEKTEISDDEEDDFEYEMVADDEPEEEDDDDDLADALAAINIKKVGSISSQDRQDNLGATAGGASSSLTQVRPSVVDDFVRNFLIKAGMKRTLDSFNSEWYEMHSKGRLPAEISSAVPDIYLRNDELDQQARVLREQVDKMRQVASRAQATWDKFRKERDFHRMHHKRVVQEKNKLITDLKRVRNHLRSYEPMIEELRGKHSAALKEKMLIKLERDRLKAKVKVLEEQVATLSRPEDERKPQPKIRSATRAVRKEAVFPTEAQAVNPFLNLDFDPCPAHQFKTRKSYRGHLNSISAVSFHPKKPIFATASDDETWKLWTAPDCELIMSGEGHTSWISSLNFHPFGSHLVTSSGDNTIKIWEFAQAKCTQTYTDHTQAVWGCEFHHGGDFIASCSMDHTVRIWDIIAGRSRQCLRGHVDSVNAVKWQPFTNNVCTVSGDKTVSVWDARSGLCVQTLYGHTNSCNDLAVTNRGDMIVSSDADGIVKLWDIRMVSELASIETGSHPVNKISLDRGGKRALCGSDDGTIKVIDLQSFSLITALTGHEDAVQCVGLSPNDAFLVSGSSDASFRIWG